MAQKNTKKRETIASVAYDQIKEKLLLGEYMPGQFLQVEEVRQDLGLGRTPVHQALHKLGQEGLLEIIPRKGILVRADSMDDVRQSLELRLLLEPYCARRCAERASPSVVETLQQCVENQAQLGPSPEQSALMQLDRDMHSIIATNAQNELIANILKPLHERMTRTWFMPHWESDDYLTTIREHRAIIDAIADRKTVAAENAMREHLMSVSQRMGMR